MKQRIATEKYIILITGPSGAGKTTLVKNLLKNKNMGEIISDTTCPIKMGEIDGLDYNYISDADFQSKTMIEKAIYDGYQYGISKEEIEKKISENNITFVVVSIDGVISIKEYMYHHHPEITCLSIFINTPSSILIDRLIKRGDNIDKIIKQINHIKETKEYENKIFCDLIYTPEEHENYSPLLMEKNFCQFLDKKIFRHAIYINLY